MCSIEIKDTGRGIAAAFLPKIFERFTQEDASKSKRYGGLGIGLALSRQLVELHDGSITAHSEGPGTGSTFTVTLPLSDDPLRSPVIERARGEPLTRLPSLVVLLVEDDPDGRDLTRRILVDAGALVIEAGNAEEALASLASPAINFLVSDVGMADLDGYQLLTEIRSRGYDAARLPAIALTAFASAKDREDAFAAGHQEHLTKPFSADQLISRLASLRTDIS